MTHTQPPARTASGRGPHEAPARIDFLRLRRAFEALSDVYDCGGAVDLGRDGVKLSRIPRPAWRDLSQRINRDAALVAELIDGPGQREAVAGRREATMAVIAEGEGDARHFSIAILETVGRGRVVRSVSIRTSEPDWRRRLAEALAWEEVEAVIACAEGNNQRAAIGLVLLLAGIGRGQMEILEVELPEEIDETTHLVRGADWLKAGLTRFRSAAGEALFALMRIRSVHARLIKGRRQGLYTSMALAALHASGLSLAACARATDLGEPLVGRLVGGAQVNGTRAGGSAPSGARIVEPALLVSELGSGFEPVRASRDQAARGSAMRVWRGPYVFVRGMAWRIDLSRRARLELAAGEGLVDVASKLQVSLRDLVRILSIGESALVQERSRFLATLADPATFRRVAVSASDRSQGVA